MIDTKVVIQLGDRSCICPEGVLENVVVKVHNFLYPADFHVIRMSDNETAKSSGVLVGRPFLRTAMTIIDVFDGTICLDYHGKKFTFIIDEAMRKPLDVENLHYVGVINPLVQKFLETELLQEQFDALEMAESVEKEVANWCEAVIKQGLTDEQITEAIMEFCGKPGSSGSKGSVQLATIEKLPELDELAKKSMEKNPWPLEVPPPKKELKTLPPGLKYAYLGEDEQPFDPGIGKQVIGSVGE